jgi:hypothetical protein
MVAVMCLKLLRRLATRCVLSNPCPCPQVDPALSARFAAPCGDAPGRVIRSMAWVSGAYKINQATCARCVWVAGAAVVVICTSRSRSTPSCDHSIHDHITRVLQSLPAHSRSVALLCFPCMVSSSQLESRKLALAEVAIGLNRKSA